MMGRLRFNSPYAFTSYLLHDEFITAAAAPVASPHTCEPGPGALKITDTGNRVTINASGELAIASGGTTGDPSIGSAGPYAIVPGLAVLASVRQDNTASANLVSTVGFNGAATGSFTGNRLRLATSADIQMSNWTTYTSTGQTYANMIDYQIAVILLETKVAYCVKGGAFTDWTLLGSQNKSVGLSTLAWLRLDSYNRAAAYKYLAIMQLPAPFHSDNAIAGGLLSADGIAVLNSVNHDALTLNEALALFANTGTGVGLTRSGDDYWMYQNQASGRRWYLKLGARTTPSAIHALSLSQIRDSEDNIIAELASDADSVWEYAYSITDVGWVGNGHGRDTESSLTFAIDGVPIVLADGQSASGSELIITRVSEFTEDDATHIADCTFTYTLSSVGLATAGSITWAVGYSVTTIHGGMMPTAELLDTGAIIGRGKHWTLDVATGEDMITHEVLTGTCGIVFDQDGFAATMLQTTDERDVYMQDRAALNKYYTENGSAETFSQTYRAAYLDGGTAELMR